MRNVFSFLFVLVTVFLNAQTRTIPAQAFDLKLLKADLTYLASDELKGRFPGTEGEDLAAAYIEKQFAKLGIQPRGTIGYKQTFEMYVDAEIGKANFMVLKGDTTSYPHGLYPVKYSSTGVATGKTLFVNFGIVAEDLDHNDLEDYEKGDFKGRIVVMDVSSPDGIHPHSKYVAHYDLEERVKRLVEYGAEGVVLINPGDLANDPNPRFERIYSVGVPVVFVTNEETAEYLSKKKKKITISAELQEKKVKAKNIVGFLNLNKEKTVVIGAHYDHLGMGTTSSLYRGVPQIHNGADDNASGTAGLLTLARYFSNHSADFSTNFLFIGFSGEEEGLLGSDYWTKNPTLDLSSLQYMLNMDMIGRLDANDKVIEVNGVGTSPLWKEKIPTLELNEIKLKTTVSGIGPSDQTSFYHIKVPALHFFTGTHSDYHKPSDDADKINYKGEAQVLALMVDLVKAMDGEKNVPFTTTVNDNSRKAPRFSVTLGVIPDYAFDGAGMKINGVNDGKPAAAAGMLEGDIVIQIGDFKIKDMYSYMDALSAYQKGDKVKVTYLRDGKEITTDLQF